MISLYKNGIRLIIHWLQLVSQQVVKQNYQKILLLHLTPSIVKIETSRI